MNVVYHHTIKLNKPPRKRNIIWFNPPYSKNVKTNVAQKFLRLIDKHFPKTSKLHKIFNRNTVKVSYSCMPNVKSTISSHNNRVLKKNNVATTNIHAIAVIRSIAPSKVNV